MHPKWIHQWSTNIAIVHLSQCNICICRSAHKKCTIDSNKATVFLLLFNTTTVLLIVGWQKKNLHAHTCLRSESTRYTFNTFGHSPLYHARMCTRFTPIKFSHSVRMEKEGILQWYTIIVGFKLYLSMQPLHGNAQQFLKQYSSPCLDTISQRTVKTPKKHTHIHSLCSNNIACLNSAHKNKTWLYSNCLSS